MQGWDWVWIATPVVLAVIAILKGFHVYGDNNKKRGKWEGQVDADRTSFKEFMRKIERKLDQIFDRLPPSPVTTSRSPLQLTDLGKQIAEEIDVQTWVHHFKQKIKGRIAEHNPYEVQEVCFKYADENLLDDIKDVDQGEVWVKKIKGSAYDHGLPLEDVLKVAGIVLRDKMLEDLNLELD